MDEVPELKGVKMLVGGVEKYVWGTVGDGCVLTSTVKNPRSFRDFLTVGTHAVEPLPQPWEVAPDGMRIVTNEEREKYNRPKGYMFFSKENSKRWCSNKFGSGEPFESVADITNYAVPIDFKFEEETLLDRFFDSPLSQVMDLGYKITIEENNHG